MELLVSPSLTKRCEADREPLQCLALCRSSTPCLLPRGRSLAAAQLCLVRPMVLVRVATAAVGLTFAACSQLPAAHFGTVFDGLSSIRPDTSYPVCGRHPLRISHRLPRQQATRHQREEFPLPRTRTRSSQRTEKKYIGTLAGQHHDANSQLGSHTRSPPEIHGIYIEDLQIAPGRSGKEITRSSCLSTEKLGKTSSLFWDKSLTSR